MNLFDLINLVLLHLFKFLANLEMWCTPNTRRTVE